MFNQKIKLRVRHFLSLTIEVVIQVLTGSISIKIRDLTNSPIIEMFIYCVMQNHLYADVIYLELCNFIC